MSPNLLASWNSWNSHPASLLVHPQIAHEPVTWWQWRHQLSGIPILMSLFKASKGSTWPSSLTLHFDLCPLHLLAHVQCYTCMYHVEPHGCPLVMMPWSGTLGPTLSMFQSVPLPTLLSRPFQRCFWNFPNTSQHCHQHHLAAWGAWWVCSVGILHLPVHVYWLLLGFWSCWCHCHLLVGHCVMCDVCSHWSLLDAFLPFVPESFQCKHPWMHMVWLTSLLPLSRPSDIVAGTLLVTFLASAPLSRPGPTISLCLHAQHCYPHLPLPFQYLWSLLQLSAWHIPQVACLVVCVSYPLPLYT